MSKFRIQTSIGYVLLCAAVASVAVCYFIGHTKTGVTLFLFFVSATWSHSAFTNVEHEPSKRESLGAYKSIVFYCVIFAAFSFIPTGHVGYGNPVDDMEYISDDDQPGRDDMEFLCTRAVKIFAVSLAGAVTGLKISSRFLAKEAGSEAT